jgi:two-component system, NtrC family, response regulator AtoC
MINDAGSWHILVVDDDPVSREVVKDTLEKAGYRISMAQDGQEAWEFVQKTPVDLVVSDLFMPRLDGLDLLRLFESLRGHPSVIIVTAFGTLDSAVEATKLGAYGYLGKPINVNSLLHLVGKAIEERRLVQDNERLQRQLKGQYGIEQILGQSQQIREIRRLIEDLATSDVRVLILGKSGTGKELVARAIHAVSPRRPRPFVAINCGGLTETLLESELFGHARGAFTGAVSARTGLIQAAEGGTLFLDEIGDMPPALQVKLLRMLEEGSVRPVGADREVKVDVRVIAATNRDLQTEVEQGRFREDLYYRINVIALTLPSLADRREDIPILAQYFLAQALVQTKRKPLRFTPEALDVLQGYAWPGNVRELRNVIERAVAVARGAEIAPKHFPATMCPERPLEAHPWWRGELALAEIEREAIRHALQQVHGNRAAAARLLQISERSLYRKLERHQLLDNE